MKMDVAALAAVCAIGMGACGARAEEDLGATGIRFELTAPPAADLTDRAITVGEPAAEDLSAGSALTLEDAKAAAGRFGQADGSWWLTVAPAAGSTFGGETTAGVRTSLTTFLAEDIQVGGELGLWYFQQPGDNAWGANLEFVLRWHFYDRGSWTVFLDSGIGVLLASNDVPEGGTSFGLMPRAGVGFTYQLTDAGMRLEAGLGWHHISNARMNGDDENPSRDLPMLHVGLVFPL